MHSNFSILKAWVLFLEGGPLQGCHHLYESFVWKPFFNSHCVQVDALLKTVRQTCSVTLASELSPCARNNLQPKCVLSISPFISTRQALSHWRMGAGKSQLCLFSKGPSFPWNPNVPHNKSDNPLPTLP